MRNNIAAFTAPGCNYPEYLSVNTDANNQVEITVRSAANQDGSCGTTSFMCLSVEEFEKLAARLYSYACTRGA